MIFKQIILTLTLIALWGCQSTQVGRPATRSEKHAAVASVAQADQALADAQALAARADDLGNQADVIGHVVAGQPRTAPDDLHRRRALAYRAKAHSYAQLANTEALLAKEVEDPAEQRHWLAEAQKSASLSKHFRDLYNEHAALFREHR